MNETVDNDLDDTFVARFEFQQKTELTSTGNGSPVVYNVCNYRG